MYLSLNGTFISSHSYVLISDIGSTDDTALICNTDRPPPYNGRHSGGEWFTPDGTRVNMYYVPGFRRNRAPRMVRLKRHTATDPPSEGMYECAIEDDTFTHQTVAVGLYNDGSGIGVRVGHYTLFPYFRVLSAWMYFWQGP